MKHLALRWTVLAAAIVVILLAVWLVKASPKNPIAMIRVVDGAGNPISGAVVQPEGLRTKQGPYVSGWYGWMTGTTAVPNPPVRTGQDGYAVVPYPKYVFEEIETGTLCLSVNHPEFVPDRPECVVATAPPAGAPWRDWLDYLWRRLQGKGLIARSDPVVLQPGATLRISTAPGVVVGEDKWFAKVSGVSVDDADFWLRPEPGVMLTSRLGGGVHSVRAVRFDTDGSAWFSDVMTITAVAGQTNDLEVTFKRGVTVRGQLDDSVPRPVTNGRVVVNILPQGLKPKNSPPQWHGCGAVREDGSFEIASLPEGDLEIVALCNGYVSTNGPGQTRMHYPQKHVLSTNDLAITIGMEPTARLEVRVTDDKGKPLPGVHVMTWPNVRYGEWSATILMSDCYNSSDRYLAKRDGEIDWGKPVPDFQGVSDTNGLAVLPNLPVTVAELAVKHPQFDLPAVGTATGRRERYASFTLSAGQTNRVSLRLEPSDQSPIRHY